MAEVSLRSVVKRYGEFQAVHGVDLEIADNEFLVLVGPSGCGKSTLLRMIAGLEDISGGEVAIGGQVVNELAPKDRDIAMVFQDYALYPHLDVARNMSFGLEMRKVPKPEIKTRVERAAQILDLSELLHRKPGQLSGGQRQRVAMGRAIVRDPKVFLFDEPLSNLDAKLRADMRIEIKKLHQEVRTTVIYVTHDQIEAMTLADRIVVMRSGRVEQIGAPDDVYNQPANLFVAGFIGAPRMNHIPARLADGGERAVEIEGGLRLSLPHTMGDLSQRAGQKVVLGLRPEAFGPAADGKPADLEAEIHLVEPLGSDTLVFFELGGAEAVARLPPAKDLRGGAKVGLTIDPERMHLFDAETEMRIGSGG